MLNFFVDVIIIPLFFAGVVLYIWGLLFKCQQNIKVFLIVRTMKKLNLPQSTQEKRRLIRFLKRTLLRRDWRRISRGRRPIAINLMNSNPADFLGMKASEISAILKVDISSNFGDDHGGVQEIWRRGEFEVDCWFKRDICIDCVFSRLNKCNQWSEISKATSS